jgi:dTDP-4-amino-4,6-dideoxygalactose transaminase
MRLGALRPVGEFVNPMPAPRRFAWPDDYRVAWLDSGTTALAVALRAMMPARADAGCRVIAPAYTCPDVLSAIEWAGGIPLLVDTMPGTPWMDGAGVASCLDATVVAVVAPHFLGIPHPLRALMQACDRASTPLVEDSAQLGPPSPGFRPVADLVVLSFGRGKPVPAGGGALLYRGPADAKVNAILSALPERAQGTTAWRTRIRLQNAAMSRLGFGLVRRLPWLNVGETRFKPLGNPRRISLAWSGQVESVLASWPHVQSSIDAELSAMAAGAGLHPLARDLGWDGRSPLLRLPVLAADREQRDALEAALEGSGLGASALYRDILPQIPGVPACEASSPLVNAQEFAGRLFTLPCHSGVTSRDIAAMARVLARVPGDA